MEVGVCGLFRQATKGADRSAGVELRRWYVVLGRWQIEFGVTCALVRPVFARRMTRDLRQITPRSFTISFQPTTKDRRPRTCFLIPASSSPAHSLIGDWLG